MQNLMEQVGGYGPLLISAIKAVVVLVVGWMVAGGVSAMVRRRVTSSPRIDETIGGFVAGAVKWVILLIVLIAVLNVFGIQATSLVAVLGAASLAIGLALQGTLSNLAAGFMLILFRPFKVGQYIDAGGTAGTVKGINLFVTELATPDNVQIIVPNGQVWGSIITNYSFHPTRRVDMTFGIDYGDDADKAMAVIHEVATADERVHSEPGPWMRVTNLGDSSVDIGVRLWCNASDYWELKFAMTKAVKEAFDKAGISIPYPHSVEIQKAG